MRKLLECAGWCVAVVVMLAGVIAFEAFWPSARKTPDTPRAVVESVHVVTTQLSPRQYALLAKHLRAYIKEQIMSSGSAKSSSSASEPTHPMPCCEGQSVSDTLFATVTTPKFGPVTVELMYGTYPNAGTGWYGTAPTCEGLILSVILYADHCDGAMMLAETPWDEGPDIGDICIAGDSTFGFVEVVCDPLMLESDQVSWGIGTLDACRCGITGVEDLSPASVVITE